MQPLESDLENEPPPTLVLNGLDTNALASSVAAVAGDPRSLRSRSRPGAPGRGGCRELELRGAFGLDPSVPAGAERIRYTIEVQGSGTREEFEEIHAEVARNSLNRYHLANPIALDAELVVH